MLTRLKKVNKSEIEYSQLQVVFGNKSAAAIPSQLYEVDRTFFLEEVGTEEYETLLDSAKEYEFYTVFDKFKRVPNLKSSDGQVLRFDQEKYEDFLELSGTIFVRNEKVWQSWYIYHGEDMLPNFLANVKPTDFSLFQTDESYYFAFSDERVATALKAFYRAYKPHSYAFNDVSEVLVHEGEVDHYNGQLQETDYSFEPINVEQK